MEKQRHEEEILHSREAAKNLHVIEEQRRIMEEAEKRRQKQVEQENRDHELAMRLAEESKGGVEDVQLPPEYVFLNIVL